MSSNSTAEMPIYKVGGNCNGDKIDKIYFQNRDKKYIIFKSQGVIKVKGSQFLSGIEEFISEIKFLTDDLKEGREKEKIFHQMAIAYNAYLSEEKDRSRQILENIIINLKSKQIVHKKICYIGVFLGFVLLMSCISLFLALFLKNYQHLKEIFYVGAFGSIGGFISLNLKLNKVEFDISESYWSYIFISIYKSIYSILAGIICYFLIKSNLFLGAINNSSPESRYFIYSISALAGFSETLLPNILNKLENASENKP